MSDFAWSSANTRGAASPARITAWLIRHPPVFTLSLIVLVSVVVGAISPEFWQISNIFDMARA